MKIKLLVISVICLFFCMSALCVTAFLAGNERDLLIALPKNIGSPKINIHEIDDFINNNFLMTYEIHYSEKVNLTHSEFPVIITGTTSSYPQIMKYVMIEGSFFQTTAWMGKLRQAVFNEKAAFTLFGSNSITGNRFRIHNDTWLVTGVIRDYDDNCCIYIPSSVRGVETNAFAMTVSDSFDETYIRNSLKSIGVRERDFDFINFNAHFKRLWERIIVLLLILVLILLLATFRHLLTKTKNAWKTIKSELSVSYPAEILQKKRKFLIKNMVPVLGIAVIPVLFLIILISVISICLPWQDIASVNKLNVSVFYNQLNRIYMLDIISRIFFIFSLVLMCVILICARKSNTAYEAGLPRVCDNPGLPD